MIIVLDVETTGLDTQTDRIVEIAIAIRGGVPTTVRVNPGIPIPPEASAVHGVTDADVAGAPGFASIAHAVVNALDLAEVVIGYNVRFDIEIVNAELARIGVEPIDYRRKHVIDPLRLWTAMEPRNLVAAHRRFVGGDFDAHRAGDDVTATMRVLTGMIDAFNLAGRGWATIAEVADPNPERRTWLGPSSHIVWRDDAAVLAFGKHDGIDVYELALHDRGFLAWIERKDFPAHVRRIAEAARRAASKRPPATREEFYTWLRKEYPSV
jgi:DNA polymerase-3 subunit epsilon